MPLRSKWDALRVMPCAYTFHPMQMLPACSYFGQTAQVQLKLQRISVCLIGKRLVGCAVRLSPTRPHARHIQTQRCAPLTAFYICFFHFVSFIARFACCSIKVRASSCGVVCGGGSTRFRLFAGNLHKSRLVFKLYLNWQLQRRDHNLQF